MKQNITRICIAITLLSSLNSFAQDFQKIDSLSIFLEKSTEQLLSTREKTTKIDSIIDYAKSIRNYIASQHIDNDTTPHCGLSWQGSDAYLRAYSIVAKLNQIKRGKVFKAKSRTLGTTLDYVKFVWPGGTFVDNVQAGYDFWENSPNVTNKVHANQHGATVFLNGTEFVVVPAQVSTTAGNFYDWLELNYTLDGSDGESFILIGANSTLGGTGLGIIGFDCEIPANAICPGSFMKLHAHEYGHNYSNYHPNDPIPTAAGAINDITNVMRGAVPLNSSVLAYEGGITSNFSLTLTPCVTTSLIALPINLIYFTVTQQNHQNLLSWRTATETNNSHFEVEKSENGIDFRSIGRVEGAGNSTTEKRYTFTDSETSKNTVYYRLRQVDMDGREDFSQIISVNPNEKNIKWTSSNTFSRIDFEGLDQNENYEVSIVNALGQVVFSQNINGNESVNNLNLSSNMMYFISVTQSGQVLLSDKMYVRK